MVYTEEFLKEKLIKELDAVHVRAERSGALGPALLLALLVRWCVAAFPYSGQGAPPLFGDYEAQRHWQEVTLHVPPRLWYRNCSHNDLQYWGLDYPPLSAYHSRLLAAAAAWLQPESVRLFASRGHEGAAHKAFMRWSVFLADLYCYASAVLCLCAARGRARALRRPDAAAALVLLYPGLVLVDHGHFQYNCVSLGLFLWAVFFVVAVENDALACVFFVLALNYKQMELYHALPFFLYLLRKCSLELPAGARVAHFARRLGRLAAVVIGSFVVIWYPLLYSWDDVLQILHRLFPVKRGVFEDKVSNVWCTVNVFIKLKQAYSDEQMLRACAACTLAAALPSCLDLFLRINRKKFILSLMNVSLAFFLFSYQVHEKSILLVAAPATLQLAEQPLACFWLLLVSTFSMLPLLLRDRLLLPLLCCCVIYGAFYGISMRLERRAALGGRCARALFCASALGMCALAACAALLPPPARLPHLWALLVSVYSCLHFLAFLLYFTYQQLSLPACAPLRTTIKNQ